MNKLFLIAWELKFLNLVLIVKLEVHIPLIYNFPDFPYAQVYNLLFNPNSKKLKIHVFFSSVVLSELFVVFWPATLQNFAD